VIVEKGGYFAVAAWIDSYAADFFGASAEITS